MKALKFILLSFLFVLISSCGSDDSEDEEACTKVIVVQPQQVVTGPSGTTVIPELTQEVSCDFDEGVPLVGTNVNPLENFTYQILSFSFIPDTGNNTRRIEFEIQLNNPNNFVAEGIPILTISADGFITASGGLANFATIPCYTIDANSNCIYTVDIEESLDVGIISEFTIIDVDYWLTTE